MKKKSKQPEPQRKKGTVPLIVETKEQREKDRIVGEPMRVPIERVRPNSYNYNVQSSATFQKLVNAVKKHGFISPIICRQLTEDEWRSRQVIGAASFGASPLPTAVGSAHDGIVYEIINGEHRYRAGIELQMKELSIVNLGVVSDTRARELSITLNELGGSPDEVRLADLLREINTEVDIGDLVQTLPFTEKELHMYIDTVDFSFSKLSDQDAVGRTKEEEEIIAAAPLPDVPADKTKRFTVSLSGQDATEFQNKLALIDEDISTAMRRAVDFFVDALKKAAEPPKEEA